MIFSPRAEINGNTALSIRNEGDEVPTTSFE